MTEQPTPPRQTDPSLDELSGETTRSIADVVSQVISTEGVRWMRVLVTGSTTDESRRMVYIRRPENDEADVKPYPVIGVGIEPYTGQWVHALETPGGLMIVGGDQWYDDYTLYDVASDYYGHHHDQYLTRSEGNDYYADRSHSHSAYLTRGEGDDYYSARGHGHGSHRHSLPSSAGGGNTGSTSV